MTARLPRLDLQSHSRHSDGDLDVPQLVAAAAAAGVELLALSDHDTVDGVQEALDAGAAAGLRIVPATEISAVDGDYEDLHVLGYGIDHRNATLLARLHDARDDRERRAERMAALLHGHGYAIDDSGLAQRRVAGKPIGRPHLAAAVLGHPDNAERLEQEGFRDVSSFIANNLIPGKPSYSGRTVPTVVDAIAWIHEAGGLAFWAHPFWDIKSEQEVLGAIDRFRAEGLDGVECFYVTHDAAQTVLLANRCTELGLLTSASSDFHGPAHRLFSRFLAYDLHGYEPSLNGLLDAR